VVWFRNKFLAGLALALPLVITFTILQFIYSLLHGWSEPIVTWFADLANEMAGKIVIQTTDPNFQNATRFIGVLIPIIALIALGVMATNFIGVHIVAAIDRLLLRIPLVSFIYKSLKQVIDSFKTIGGTQNFKRVAYIDYPVPGMRLIGFVTGQFTDTNSGKAMTAVFVPTAPNPMSGLLLIVDSEKVTDAPLTVEDSMKLIFSGGLVVPESTTPPLNFTSPHLTPPSLDQDAEVVTTDPSTPPLGEASTDLPLMLNLPRAEDFDSGDPDILSDADELDPASVTSARTSTTSRLARVLPWRRR
jgi:uncharacterized membrane protein